MVISYLHFIGVATLPPEADAPLAIDPNTMLAVASPLQLLKSIARGHGQIMQ